jgi:PII-like signaling protein
MSKRDLLPSETVELPLKLSQLIPTTIRVVNRLKKTRVTIDQTENLDGSRPVVTITIQKVEMVKFRRLKRLVWKDRGQR